MPVRLSGTGFSCQSDYLGYIVHLIHRTFLLVRGWDLGTRRELLMEITWGVLFQYMHSKQIVMLSSGTHKVVI